jgi:hypothetical protein
VRSFMVRWQELQGEGLKQSTVSSRKSLTKPRQELCRRDLVQSAGEAYALGIKACVRVSQILGCFCHICTSSLHHHLHSLRKVPWICARCKRKDPGDPLYRWVTKMYEILAKNHKWYSPKMYEWPFFSCSILTWMYECWVKNFLTFCHGVLCFFRALVASNIQDE